MKYIGITDFTEESEVRAMLRVLENTNNTLGRRLMVGVMMSWKTLNELPTTWSNVWPANEEIAGIFIDHPGVQNTLNYADYDNQTTIHHLLEAIQISGTQIHALQLDMIWPDVHMVHTLKNAHPDLAIIMQANAGALSQVYDDPSRFVTRLNEYGSAIDGVLLNRSMGRGAALDANALLPFARAIKSVTKKVAVAGGLGPHALHLVEPLIKEFPDISIDAQEQLRVSGDAQDPINWLLARNYIVEAMKLFEKYT